MYYFLIDIVFIYVYFNFVVWVILCNNVEKGFVYIYFIDIINYWVIYKIFMIDFEKFESLRKKCFNNYFDIWILCKYYMIKKIM